MLITFKTASHPQSLESQDDSDMINIYSYQQNMLIFVLYALIPHVQCFFS